MACLGILVERSKQDIVYNSRERRRWRNHIMGTPNLAYGVLPGCLVHNDPLSPCCIFLPRRSPSETFEYLQNQPMENWSVTFLCLRHGTVCVRGSDDVHVEICPTDQDQPSPTFWEIECACGQESCGKLHTIYSGGMPDCAKIVKQIVKLNPIVPCGSHNLVWQPEKIFPRQIL